MPPFKFPPRPPQTDAERRLDLMKWQLLGHPRQWLACRDLLRASPPVTVDSRPNDDRKKDDNRAEG